MILFFLDTPHIEPLTSTTIHTGLGAEHEIVCTVHSSPRAKLVWTRDGKPLDSSDSIGVSGGIVTSLSLLYQGHI